MKRILLSVAVLLFAGVVLVSCNKNSARSVATTWLNDFYHADYEGAMPLSTEATKAQMKDFAELAGYVNDSMKKDLKKLAVTVKDVKETGDTAIATYVLADTKRDQQLMLIKQNGKWLVAFTKNDSYKNNDFGGDLPATTDTTATHAVPVDTAATDTAKNKD
jgi:hypothetical protein